MFTMVNMCYVEQIVVMRLCPLDRGNCVGWVFTAVNNGGIGRAHVVQRDSTLLQVRTLLDLGFWHTERSSYEPIPKMFTA